MAKYRLFQRDPITGHMNVTAEYNCNSDAEAAYLARKDRHTDSMILCDDDLHVVRHFAVTSH